MHRESLEHEGEENGSVWDCTLIKVMKEQGDTVVNPIYTWTDADIWEYIRENNIKVNPLYERGYKRVGCIGCPLATYGQVIKEFMDYPKYEEAYKRTFQRMIDKRRSDGKGVRESWEDGEAVFDWWIEKWKHETRGQMTFDFKEEQK